MSQPEGQHGSSTPTPPYEILSAPGISKGRQSNVDVIEFKLSTATEPVVWKRMAAGRGLSELEADALHSRLRKYRRELRAVGWNVPKLFHTHIARVGDEWQIWSYEQYVPGGDADHLVRSNMEPVHRKWYVVRTAIETLAEYPTDQLHRRRFGDRELSGLAHGIDLKLANLVEDRGVVWLVDIFGIKQLEPYVKDTDLIPSWDIYSAKLESLDPEKLFLVCATREGMILRLLRLAEDAWTNTGEISVGDFRQGALSILDDASLPLGERSLIAEELLNNYRWLDTIYSETRI